MSGGVVTAAGGDDSGGALGACSGVATAVTSAQCVRPTRRLLLVGRRAGSFGDRGGAGRGAARRCRVDGSGIAGSRCRRRRGRRRRGHGGDDDRRRCGQWCRRAEQPPAGPHRHARHPPLRHGDRRRDGQQRQAAESLVDDAQIVVSVGAGRAHGEVVGHRPSPACGRRAPDELGQRCSRRGARDGEVGVGRARQVCLEVPQAERASGTHHHLADGRCRRARAVGDLGVRQALDLDAPQHGLHARRQRDERLPQELALVAAGEVVARVCGALGDVRGERSLTAATTPRPPALMAHRAQHVRQEVLVRSAAAADRGERGGEDLGDDVVGVGWCVHQCPGDAASRGDVALVELSVGRRLAGPHPAQHLAI